MSVPPASAGGFTPRKNKTAVCAGRLPQGANGVARINDAANLVAGMRDWFLGPSQAIIRCRHS